MTDIVLFALLGLGAGAAYALVALGIVLIQKGSGAVNFAQGAIAGTAAIYFAVATDDGTPVAVAALIALASAAVGGALFHLLVMRPLRNAPLLARIVSTLALMVVIQGLATRIWPSPSVVAPQILPADSFTLFGIAFGVDRLWLLGLVVVLTAGLWALYRFTVFGRATRASAESERGAMLLGYSPDLIGAVNWALGSMLAALAGILIAPIATLDINTLALLVVPALAAALVGRFSSFAVTATAAVVIGVVQSLLINFWQQPGVNQALPFLLVLLTMLLTGRAVPERGGLSAVRDPVAADRPARCITWGPVVVVVAGTLAVANDVYRGAVTTSLIFAVLALSLVVVTGFVGQISLAQMAFAGIGGFATSKFAAGAGLPFPVPLLLAALVAVPVGVLLGLPALRVRGINLAVLTLGAAVTFSAAVFQNADITGGVTGSAVPPPAIAGFSLDSVEHPVRFGLFCLLVAALLVVAVLNLRHGASGRRMLAVRANERAAAVVGIDVRRTKLVAFALSSFVAAIGGGLFAYQLGAVAFDRFSPLASVMLLATAYIGGIATVRGAVFAGFIATGGVLYTLLSSVDGLDSWWIVLSGVLLLVTVVTQPSGAVISLDQTLAALRGRRHRTTTTPRATVVEGENSAIPNRAV